MFTQNAKIKILQFSIGFLIMSFFVVIFFNEITRGQREYLVPDESNIGNVTQVFRKELMIGSVGPDVIEVQEKLSNINVFDIEGFNDDEKGFFGEQTQYYVTLFQYVQDITPHGRVDDRTWKRLSNPQPFTREQVDNYRAFMQLGNGFEIDDIYYAPQFQKITFLTFRGIDDLRYQKMIGDLLNRYDASATFFITPDRLKNFDEHIRNDRRSSFGMYMRTPSELTKSASLSSKYGLWCVQPSYTFQRPENIDALRLAGFQPIRWSVDPQNAYNDNIDKILDHIITYTQHYDTVSFDVSDETDKTFLILLEKYLQKMTSNNWQVLAPACG